MTTCTDSRQHCLDSLAAIKTDTDAIAELLRQAAEQTWAAGQQLAERLAEYQARHAELADQVGRYNAQFPADSPERIHVPNPTDTVGQRLPLEVGRLFFAALRSPRLAVEELARAAIRSQA